MIGDGPLRDAVEARADAHDAAGLVRMVGFVDDVGPYLDACDVVVVPTEPDLSEGFGLAALEAMAAAKPVIATDVGSLPEVVVDGVTGLIVAPSSTTALRDALVGCHRPRPRAPRSVPRGGAGLSTSFRSSGWSTRRSRCTRRSHDQGRAFGEAERLMPLWLRIGLIGQRLLTGEVGGRPCAGLAVGCRGLRSFAIVVVLVPMCRRFALLKGIADYPAPGKVHKDPTPYLGGVAIALAAASCSLVLPSWKGDAAIIVAAALLVGALGLVDDVRTVRPSIRLVVETLAALAAVSAGARVQLFGDVPDIALTILWIVVITNASISSTTWTAPLDPWCPRSPPHSRPPCCLRAKCSWGAWPSLSPPHAWDFCSTTGLLRRFSWATRDRCSLGSSLQ